MTVLAPFILNAGLNFVLGLLIALFLGPAEFGRYAIGAAIIVLVNTALLDWIKLSAVRFYSLKTRATQPEIRATLDVLAAGISLSLSALLVAAVAAGLDVGLPAMLLSGAVLAGIGAGLFDYHGAIARARFLDAAYARLIVVKNIAALVLMVGGAWLTRDPVIVLFGALLSSAVALMLVRRALADAPLSFSAASGRTARMFAAYALPIVAGNAIYSLIPLANRSLLAGAQGYAEAGQFSLASDIGLRLFSTLGAMLEILLLRRVLQLDERRGRPAALAAIGRNLMPVLMVALPMALGLFLVLPAFEQLLVPAGFRGSFAAYMALLLPGFVSIAIFQAALYPVFLLEKRTIVATLAALSALAVNLLWLGLGGSYAMAQSAAFLTVVLVTGTVTLRAIPNRPRLREVAGLLLALGAMALAVWPLRGQFAPGIEIVLQASVGALVYAGVLLAADTARCRRRLGRALRSVRRRRGR